MDESLPATSSPDKPAASGQTTEKEQTPRRAGRRRRVPTSLLVTFVGIALTAWLLPAFTRQWDDRPKVRELQAVFADEIAASTTSALARGAGVVQADLKSILEPRPHFNSAQEGSLAGSRAFLRRQRSLAPIETDWDVARERVRLKLAAYYPRAVVSAWNDFAGEITSYLRLCKSPR